MRVFYLLALPVAYRLTAHDGVIANQKQKEGIQRIEKLVSENEIVVILKNVKVKIVKIFFMLILAYMIKNI